jgi:N-acetylmuramoyl-L-alanine amidase
MRHRADPSWLREVAPPVSDRPALPIIDLPSPNHDERNETVDMLILHYTGMKTAGDAIDRLRDREAAVSSH